MNQVHKEQDLESKRFNEDWDKQFFDLAEKYSGMEIKLKMDQEKELFEKIDSYEKNLPDKYKMSTELLNKKKIYEKAIKQKEWIFHYIHYWLSLIFLKLIFKIRYKKAEELKDLIHDLEIREQIKFSKERENKIKKEREKKELKLANEYKLFNDRITLIYNELKTNRQIEYDNMIHRHKCVVKELEANQKLEISNLDKITKGISSKIIFLFFRA